MSCATATRSKRRRQALAAAIAQQLGAGRFPLVLGGGHEIALGVVHRACHAPAETVTERRASASSTSTRTSICGATHAPPPARRSCRSRSDCEARGWPFRYACLGVSRYSNTEALFARAQELGVLWFNWTRRSTRTLRQRRADGLHRGRRSCLPDRSASMCCRRPSRRASARRPRAASGSTCWSR